MTSDHALDTTLQHTGLAPFDPRTESAPVAVPIMRTSTVRFRTLDALDRAQAAKADPTQRSITYGRSGMDTHAALESVFCELESASQALLAPSGMAAISLAMLGLLDTGDHVLIADSAYGPVRYLEKTVLRRLGIQATFCAPTLQELERHRKPNTRMLYLESPGSLLMQMLDMPALAEFGRRHDMLLVTDNTWGSGYIYRPLELGFDVSVVAGTKYVAGHSDLMLGAVMSRDLQVNRRLHENHYALGFSISADDAWLALRGVRTLPIRMRESAANALKVCEFLAARPEVSRLYHPAWPQDPGHALWQRDCTGSNGMLSVQLRLNPVQARAFVDALTLFGIGFSWGGFESLVQLVDTSALKSHSYWPQTDDALVRLHIGLESAQDLCADLAQAFNIAARV
ncbi:MAG TPA: aminotransferase class I/II-fold pyridoxal phosphate-dependent enzyme [Alcaligenes sp.]|nr:aminotransferase class I/II-fold pyridoxal phosphate-dependent enzyme [Alcaligenes sp.]HRL26591.1 aminotransferase class I/II-fold pyridoxal phosphate-dependent enzyme [Alcaligenes sp.]